MDTEEVHIIPPDHVVPPEANPPTRPLSLIDPPHVPIPPYPSTLVGQSPLLTMITHVDEVADDLITSVMTPQVELLHWYYCLAHRLFRIICLFAYLRIIPYHLRFFRPPPMCACCKYGDTKRTPWIVKGATNRGKIFPTTRAGEFFSVNQIESYTPSFLAQLKGGITCRRYRATTVFLDIFSDLSYVHLQSSTNSADTLDTKKGI